MLGSLDRLIALNFRRVGNWELSNTVLRLVLPPPMPTAQDLLYAFTVDGELSYIGKTTQGLVRRMQGYRSPPATAERGGSTNINNNRRIVEALTRGASVDIYVLDNLPPHQHGGFQVNLAAGLEDTLVRELSPAWNGQRMQSAPRASVGPSPALTGASVPAPIPQQAPSLAKRLVSSDSVPSVDELFAFCRGARGSSWITAVRRSVFAVEVDGPALAITPASSRAARREGRETVKAVLERLEGTGSYRMSDYADISFNASYLLALVQACQHARTA